MAKSEDHEPDLRWSKFWWQDYDADRHLRLCSLAAQGLWMRMLCIMHTAKPYGHLVMDDAPLEPDDLAALIGKDAASVSDLVSELERRRVFSRTDTGIIFCRRMVRDMAAYIVGRENGKKGGNPHLKRPPEQKVNPKSEQEVSEGVNPPLNPQEAEKQKKLEAKKDIPPSADADDVPPWDRIVRDFLPFVAERTKTDISTTKGRDRVMAFLGKMRREAGNDATLMEILLDAEREPPRDIASWVKAAISRKNAKGPVLAVDNDPNDHWGIEAWCRSLPGVLPAETENDRRRGKWLFAGTVIDYVARRIAEAAQLPPTWRGDWSLLGEWLSAGHDDGDIMEIIVGSVGRVDSITSLRFFDDRVRRTPTENLKYLQKLQRKSA